MALMKYYIQKGTDSAKELYSAYRIYILDTEGWQDAPTPKKKFTENWANKNGQTVYEPVIEIFEPQKVEIEFAALGDSQTAIANYKAMVNYMKSVFNVVNGYGKSEFSIWNDKLGQGNAKTIRYEGFSGKGKMMYDGVIDYNNPNTMVSAWTFKLSFMIDKPTF